LQNVTDILKYIYTLFANKKVQQYASSIYFVVNFFMLHIQYILWYKFLYSLFNLFLWLNFVRCNVVCYIPTYLNVLVRT